MKSLRSILLITLFALFFTGSAAADVVFGPVMAVALAIHYWYVTLLIISVIVITIILIRKLKQKGD